MTSLFAVQLVGVGGALGAVLRYAVYAAVGDTEYPYATLVVNILGSFLLGIVTFGVFSDETFLLFGVGLCGSFTTYSSFSVDVVRLWERNHRLLAVAHAMGNLVLSLGAIGAAWLLTAGAA